MNSLIFWLWFGNIVFDTVGQLAFKAAAAAPEEEKARAGHSSLLAYWCRVLRRPALWLGIFSYVAEFLLWLAFLTLVPLSEGVLLGSLNIIVIMVLGRLFFHEVLTPLRLAGIGLVALGVAVVGAF